MMGAVLYVYPLNQTWEYISSNLLYLYSFFVSVWSISYWWVLKSTNMIADLSFSSCCFDLKCIYTFFLNLILFIFLYSRFLLVIHFIHISVYMSIPVSQFITPPPPDRHFHPLVSIHLFSTSVSQFLSCKLVHLYHFSRFHIYALTYDICFSLSDFTLYDSL